MSTEKLDLIIFGATGFTGKCVVRELYRINKYFEKDITWGIAGRSHSKLHEVLKYLQKNNENDKVNVEIIIADVNDEESLKTMCRRSKLVINCCGPYRFYGESVVKACIECGTHHIDVSGEPAFMEKMQLLYDEAARKAGVYVISACGFDSIPADLGVVYLQNKFDGDVNSIEAFLNFTIPEGKGKGSVVFNYATWESLVHSFSEIEDLKRVRRQLFPNRLPYEKPKLKERSNVHKNEKDGKWYIPLFGADRAVVSRTQRYLHDKHNKIPVQFNVFVSLPSYYYVLVAMINGIILNILTKYALGRTMLLKYPRLFSFGLASEEGPSNETMEHLQYLVRLEGEGWSKECQDRANTDKRMTVEVTGTNPMYGATAIASIFSAITILKEADKIPEVGGVLTPGAAFANTSFIDQLTKHCMKFRIVNQENIKSKL